MRNSPFQHKSTSQENTQPTQENTLKDTQPTQGNTLEDKYDSTLGSLPVDLFIYVACHLSLERNIASLLCVCKKVTLRVLRELCHITGYCSNVNPWGTSYLFKPTSSHIVVVRSFTLYLYPLKISYDTSPWWDMLENPPRLIIRRLIINSQSEVMYSKPSSNLWDLSNLNSLAIEMPEISVRDKQISFSETGNPSLWEELLDLYQLPSLKEMVLVNPYITLETWGHLNSNLESIQLVNCQLESPCNINLGKFEYLKEFTIYLKPMEYASCESYLDLTKCTIEFPGMSERLKFEDNRVLKVL
jgi:hypothetical protein